MDKKCPFGFRNKMKVRKFDNPKIASFPTRETIERKSNFPIDSGLLRCNMRHTMSKIKVTKRNGQQEEFSVEKIEKIVNWAVEGLSGVNANAVCVNAQLQYHDGITTSDIHKVIIDSAVGLISVKTPNYQFVAGRLLNYQLRKDVWGGKNPPLFIDFIKKNVEAGIYDSEILNLYSEPEINKLGDYISHKRDDIFTYAGIQQLCDKYLVQNRKTGEIFETPQFAYMLVAMTLFSKYDSKIRLSYVKAAYDSYSKHKVNLPTPLMAGVRTKLRQYASCCLIDIPLNRSCIFTASISRSKI
jgi:ribonucleoside-diphosphate reductase alpha chain